MSKTNKSFALSTICTLTPFALFAAGKNGMHGEYNAALIVMITLVFILLFAVLVLGNIVRQMGFVYRDKFKEQQNRNTAKNVTVITWLLLLLSANVHAQTEIASPTSSTVAGLPSFDFYLLASVIVFELFIVFALSFQLKKLIKAISADTEPEVIVIRQNKVSFWDRFNKATAIEKEHDILLDHNYDGIQELDNSLPPWWKYGFYVTIVVSMGYMWHYHIGGNGPSSYDEYIAQEEKGEADKAAYLAQAANLVDENNVHLLDAPGIASGEVIYKNSCAACHASDGGGGVGPNLTDEYWLHGGSIKDIFKSIKYGWPDKGMKSWKDDFSPKQLAELTSYIKSLKGSTPAAPKEKQGDPFIESEQNADTITAKVAVK